MNGQLSLQNIFEDGEDLTGNQHTVRRGGDQKLFQSPLQTRLFIVSMDIIYLCFVMFEFAEKGQVCKYSHYDTMIQVIIITLVHFQHVWTSQN